MDLPVIETPVFPRWIWMEEITYSHIPIATIITAFMILAPLFEYIGYVRRDPRWDRLAYGLIFIVMLLFSPGAALGTGIPIFIIGTYPEFWSSWSNLFFWPLVIQFILFLVEVFFLFFMYYMTWDRWRRRKKKRLHIWMGVCAALAGYCVQFVWDCLGSYMLTPGTAALPAPVGEPVGFSLAGFFNPTWHWLFIHRTFGNFSYAMLLTAGILALRFKNAKDQGNRDYFRFARDVTVVIGFLAFFAMPLIGWGYAKAIQQHANVAFQSMMGGHASKYFNFKMQLIFCWLLIVGTWLFTRWKSRALPLAITAGMATLGVFIWIHPALDWLGDGNQMLWKSVATAVLAAMIAVMWLLRMRTKADAKPWQWLLFVSGLAASVTFAMGGFVRERIRQPYTVMPSAAANYTGLQKPEAARVKEGRRWNWEHGRYLAYQTCLTECHDEHAAKGPRSAKDFGRKYSDLAALRTVLADDNHKEVAGREIEIGIAEDTAEKRKVIDVILEYLKEGDQ